MDESSLIKTFLAGDTFAVAGASRDRSKYGNMVLRALQQLQKEVFPINPHADEIEGLAAFPSVKSVDQDIHGLSIITPPHITAEVVTEAIEKGIGYLWMQPGAENEDAIKQARNAGIHVIANGPCLLVAARFRG